MADDLRRNLEKAAARFASLRETLLSDRVSTATQRLSVAHLVWLMECEAREALGEEQPEWGGQTAPDYQAAWQEMHDALSWIQGNKQLNAYIGWNLARIATDLIRRAYPGLVEGERFECEPMVAGEDGWSDWVHPVPGYRMQCCDCGLIHEAEFRITEREDDAPLNVGESDDAVIIFRMRRHENDTPISPEEIKSGMRSEVYKIDEQAVRESRTSTQ